MEGEVNEKTTSITFGEFEYDKPGTYKYTVSETGENDGVTNDKEAAGKTVTVTVVDNGDGTLTATADYTDEKPLQFTNTYSVEPTTAKFPVEKILEVPEELDGPESWKYTISVKAEDGAPAAEKMEYTISVKAEDGAPAAEKMEGEVNEKTTSITFGEFKYEKPGTYKYTVSEIGEIKGVTNDAEAAGKTVTVTVVDNKDGTMTATADYTDEKPLQFTNTYSVEPTTAKFPIEKVIEFPKGVTKDLTGAFTFTLTAEGEAPMPKTTSYTNPDPDGGEVTFGEIEYTKPDTYTYTITETGNVDGITNDPDAAKTVTVEVVDNGDGTLTATPSTDDEPVVFTNTWETGELEVTKTVESDLAADKEEEFNFTVTLDFDGEITGTFGDMDFNKNVATFTLKGGETKKAEGLPAAVTYTVTEEDADGFTTEKTGDTGTISKDEAAKAEFTNTRETGDLTVTKTVKSIIEEDKQVEFNFTVTLDDTTIEGVYGDMEFNAGVANFVMKDGDSKTATGLPTTLGYTVEEESKGFVVEKTGDSGEITKDGVEAAFTNIRALRDVTIKKAWIDHDDILKLRPAVLKVWLLANGEQVDFVTLTADNGWDRTIKNVLVYDEEGNEIEYTWREERPSGYTLVNTIEEEDGTKLVNECDIAPGVGEVFINVGDCFE